MLGGVQNRTILFWVGKLVSILSRKIYAACSSEIFLSEILVENQNCTISVGIFSVYISKGFIPFRNRVIPNADHWSQVIPSGPSVFDTFQLP